MIENNYYVYAYLRSKDSATAKAGTPYYIGKGKGNRYAQRHSVSIPKDQTNIQFIAQNLNESDAHVLEIEMISKHGRQDLGTGILRNLTNGGEGVSGRKDSDETRRKKGALNKGVAKTIEHKAKQSLIMTGKPGPNKGRKFGPAPIERRAKQSAAQLGKVSYIRTAEHNAKNAEANKGKHSGPRSEEDKQKMRKPKGPQKRGVCPHCELECGVSNLKKYHLDNCKRKI